MLEALCRSSGTTLDIRMSRDGPPITQRTSGLSGEAGSVGDAQMIDLKGKYLMPGLWDVHIHPDYLSLDEMPLADQVTLFGHRLAAPLRESGIFGLGCAGAPGSGRSIPDSMSARGCSPAAISSPPRADIS